MPGIGTTSGQPALEHPPIGIIQVRGRVPSPAAQAWQRHLHQIYSGD